MSTLAILCSGQGTQGPGMFDLVADAPEAAQVFAAAAAALGGRDPRDIAAKEGAYDLHANATAQILCCTQAMAAWAVLKPKLGECRLVVAGYSVGEVAAWGVAGAFSPAIVFDVASRRAALMDASTDRPAGLIAIRGLSRRTIEILCRNQDVHVAIRNGADRVVIGGRREALDRARSAAEAQGAHVTPIPVGVPSHTPLMREAAEKLGAFLRGLDGIRPPGTRLFSGIDGAPVFDAAEGLDKLARQVAEPVDWAACMEACRAAGAIRALELGPGDALARMMSEVLGAGDSRSMVEFRSVSGALTWLGQ